MGSDILIQIGGSARGLQDALNQVSKDTAELESQLKGMAEVSGLAFAALVGGIGVAIHNYGEAQKAQNDLTLAMQNQGIASKELVDNYNAQAAALSTLTGIDDDVISSSQAVLQGYIGQQQITEQLTKSVLDLAAAKDLDLKTSAELIGKGINGQVGALARLGIQVDENLSKQARTAKILELVTQKFGGAAAKANEGVGSIKGLATAFGNVTEEVGGRFEPAFTAATKALTSFLNGVKENKPLLDFIVSMAAAGVVVAGLGLSVATAGIAFIKLKEILAALEIATEAQTIAFRGLVGATGIGLVIIVATELYLHWNSIWPRMQAVFHAFVDNVGPLASGLGKILSGAFFFDAAKIAEGMAQVKAAFTKGANEALAEIKAPEAEVKQDGKKKELADKEAREQEAAEQRKLAVLHASRELQLLEIQGGSDDLIALKRQEAETLKAIEDDKNKAIRTQLQGHLDNIRLMEEVQRQEDQARRTEFQQQVLADNDEYQALTEEQQQVFLEQNQKALQGKIETDSSTRRLIANESLKQQIDSNNTYIKEQQKFGTAYATINKAMHSAVFQGSKQAFGELAQLQQSSNSTLKAIGKAAAVANIIIKTAESAMSIYAGFSTIPIIGPALGVAGAAAAIAFGAEQVSNVTAAADGGLITGGIRGVDSVPAMLMPGELVVPRNNFEEVVSATAAARSGQSPGGDAGDGGAWSVVLELKDDLVDFIEAKIVERQARNTSLLPRLGTA